MTQMKLCPDCGQMKAPESYYTNCGELDYVCKECKRQRIKRYARKGQKEPRSTRDARRILAANGIACVTGREAGFTYVDLAAWGCVPIEAKGCTIRVSNGGRVSFNWSLSHGQQKRGFPQRTLLILIGWYPAKGDIQSVFVVPADEICNGDRFLYVVTNPKQRTGNTVEQAEYFKRHANAFGLIEQARLKCAQELIDDIVY